MKRRPAKAVAYRVESLEVRFLLTIAMPVDGVPVEATPVDTAPADPLSGGTSETDIAASDAGVSTPAPAASDAAASTPPGGAAGSTPTTPSEANSKLTALAEAERAAKLALDARLKAEEAQRTPSSVTSTGSGQVNDSSSAGRTPQRPLATGAGAGDETGALDGSGAAGSGASSGGSSSSPVAPLGETSVTTPGSGSSAASTPTHVSSGGLTGSALPASTISAGSAQPSESSSGASSSRLSVALLASTGDASGISVLRPSSAAAAIALDRYPSLSLSLLSIAGNGPVALPGAGHADGPHNLTGHFTTQSQGNIPQEAVIEQFAAFEAGAELPDSTDGSPQVFVSGLQPPVALAGAQPFAHWVRTSESGRSSQHPDAGEAGINNHLAVDWTGLETRMDDFLHDLDEFSESTGAPQSEYTPAAPVWLSLMAVVTLAFQWARRQNRVYTLDRDVYGVLCDRSSTRYCPGHGGSSRVS